MELRGRSNGIFSSPGRMGRPIGSMRRFLKKASLPAGAKYAILATEMAPAPDKKTGKMPTPEEIAKWQKVEDFAATVSSAVGAV